MEGPAIIIEESITIIIIIYLADWIYSSKPSASSLFGDLHDSSLDPIDCVFLPSVRPDLIFLDDSKIAVLELTICHEKNILKSRSFKMNKYKDLQPKYKKASSASAHHRNFSSRFYFELERFLHISQNPKYANFD